MIPKIIHYCWFGDAPLPKTAQRCIDSWKKHCPDFEIRKWSEKDFDVTQNEYTRQAYEAKAWGFVPDYIRLWIVYNHGGIYLDTDVQVIRDLTPLLNNKAFAGFEDESYVALGLGFGAEPGNPFIFAHMQQYGNLSFINEDGSLNKRPSPEYTTELLQTMGMQQSDGTIQKLDHVTLYPRDFFAPKNFHTGLVTLTENSYSIHQYDSSWFTEEQQLQKTQRWKRVKKREAKRRRRDLLDHILHWPNRTLLTLLGEERYERFKATLKGK